MDCENYKNEAVQRMIDWIEGHLDSAHILKELSESVGYSPYYCSAQFHRVSGITIRSYVSARRLSNAAIMLRDTDERIIDVALSLGYSSQEAFSRAFMGFFGVTPAIYRKNPRPIPLYCSKHVLFPEDYNSEGEKTMAELCLKEPAMRIEYIPAHKYIGIWESRASNYGEFWNYHNCDEVCGIIESMSNESDLIVTCHTAGWYYVNGERRYFYGLGVPADYDGEVPSGFEIRSFPGSYYAVFYHPPFDYLKDCGEVMGRVEKLAWNYDITKLGMSDASLGYADTRQKFAWNEKECQCYQRHYPEMLGYEVLRPIRIAK